MAELCRNNKIADNTDEQPTHTEDKMTQKGLVRVCVASWAIIGLPCGTPAILTVSVDLLKAELADAFLYPYTHSCKSNSTD